MYSGSVNDANRLEPKEYKKRPNSCKQWANMSQACEEVARGSKHGACLVFVQRIHPWQIIWINRVGRAKHHRSLVSLPAKIANITISLNNKETQTDHQFNSTFKFETKAYCTSSVPKALMFMRSISKSWKIWFFKLRCPIFLLHWQGYQEIIRNQGWDGGVDHLWWVDDHWRTRHLEANLDLRHFKSKTSEAWQLGSCLAWEIVLKTFLTWHCAPVWAGCPKHCTLA